MIKLHHELAKPPTLLMVCARSLLINIMASSMVSLWSGLGAIGVFIFIHIISIFVYRRNPFLFTKMMACIRFVNSKNYYVP